MSAAKTYQVAAWDEWTSAISVLICTPVLFVLFVIHALKAWQDLFTTERKSVAHRRHKPPINTKYKLNVALTVLSIFGYTLSTLFNALQGVTTHSESECRRWNLPTLYAYMLAKLCLYLQFIVKLHQVYGQSAHGYSKRSLVAVAIAISMVIFATMVAQALVIKDADIYEGYESFPYYCHFLVFQPVLVIMALTDLVAGIASLVAFLLPLRRTLKDLKHTKTSSSQKVSKQMVYVATKYTILVVSAVVSTILLLTIIAVAGVTAAAVIDVVVNCFCLVLMTPYYKEIWYRKLCFLCLCTCCCEHGGRSKTEEETKSVTDATSAATSTGSTSTLEVSSAAVASIVTVESEEFN